MPEFSTIFVLYYYKFHTHTGFCWLRPFSISLRFIRLSQFLSSDYKYPVKENACSTIALLRKKSKKIFLELQWNSVFRKNLSAPSPKSSPLLEPIFFPFILYRHFFLWPNMSAAFTVYMHTVTYAMIVFFKFVFENILKYIRIIE